MHKLSATLWLLALLLLAAPVRANEADVALHLLDYIAVEYPQFVRDGEVTEPDEYAEQVEFSTQLGELISRMPANVKRDSLLQQAAILADLVKSKAKANAVVNHASSLKLAIIDAYELKLGPRSPPDLATASALYANQCAACHGVDGLGDGTASTSLDPKPTNFRDRSRQSRRTVQGLFSTISMGVTGTSMKAFTELSEADRWALAFYVAGMQFTDAQRATGAKVWESGRRHDQFKKLSDLVLVTPADLAEQATELDFVMAYLLASPKSLLPTSISPINYSLEAMAESAKLYREGDKQRAYERAVSAYLEGFELVEATVDSADSSIKPRLEEAMMSYRNLLKKDASADEVQQQHNKVETLLREARDAVTQRPASAQAQFFSSLVIILREGLEAVLVLAGMAAFLARTGRREGLKWLHSGWLVALALGALTWWLATRLIAVSGAQREVTEGITALLAAAMLLYVGFWLHSKSHGQRWSQFIKAQVSGALGKGTLWGLAVISFVAVYREVFETVLFYQALIAQGNAGAVLGGFAAGCVGLAVIALLIMRFSARLPLGVFFTVSSVLLAAMAVVFAGQGVAALQEAGKLPVDPITFPTIPILGVYPNKQGLTLQLILVVVIAVLYFFNYRTGAKQA